MSDDKARFHFYPRDLIALGVIALLGLSLLAMFLPPLGDGPGGRNMQCKNNVRQLAIALDSFENHMGRYSGRVQTLGEQPISWTAALLPQFERLDLYKDWADPTVKNKPTPFLELLVCPRSDSPAKGPQLSYVANAGLADLANVNTANGVFHDLTKLDPTQFPMGDRMLDGSSNTIVFSENLQATTWDSVRPYETIFVWHATVQPTKEMLINGGDLKLPVTAATARPSSKHGGGVNVAFADTHVIFLRDDIDYAVYAQLMTPNDRDSDMPDGWKVPLDETRYK